MRPFTYIVLYVIVTLLVSCSAPQSSYSGDVSIIIIQHDYNQVVHGEYLDELRKFRSNNKYVPVFSDISTGLPFAYPSLTDGIIFRNNSSSLPLSHRGVKK